VSAIAHSRSVSRIRCALYTRKSSEEGLEQEFNSLDAQREACEAYVLSQAGEGWAPLQEMYDDGGFSGGSMERPALKRLLADAAHGRIDVIVVYKIDRLTRSLADFAKMVEIFDRHGVSFVSVTQAFNTTTSMGRLTLNVLLSFAQFEREVTGERIRDKIAASKAKGMWMGGVVPLGYEARERSLIIVPTEAELVRSIFRSYLEFASVHDLKRRLDAQGIVSKVRTSRRGRTSGGQSFGRGALFHMLRNRIYLGEISHKGRIYPGRHEAIVDEQLFGAVQAELDGHVTPRRNRPARVGPQPLRGLVFDAEGIPMPPTFAYGALGRVHRYYVSAPLQRGAQRVSDGIIRRAPAAPLEELVLNRIRQLAAEEVNWPVARKLLRRVEIRVQELHLLLAPHVATAQHASERLLVDETVSVDDDGAVRLNLPIRFKLRGGRTWLVTPSGASPIQGRIDAVMVRGLRKAHATLRDHSLTPSAAPDVLREARRPQRSYARRLINLAFLSPEIQRLIVEGRQPAGLTLQQLLATDIPLSWTDQKAALRFQ